MLVPGRCNRSKEDETVTDVVPPGIRLGIVRSISYGLFGKPDDVEILRARQQG
jgi:hypothetical protein